MNDPTVEEAKLIAKDAYIYGFPLVMNYKTMYMYTLKQESPEYKGPFNFLKSTARLYTPEDKAIITPNADTPYSMGWTDIRKEPIVISVPEVEEDRFYHFQLIDLFTHNFGYIGSLTTGNKAGKYLVAYKGWEGELPEGVDNVIFADTKLFFIIVRTQLFNGDDLKRVKSIQDNYQIQALSEFLTNDKEVTNSSLEGFPIWNEGDQFDANAFQYLNYLFGFIDIAEDEQDFVAGLAKISVGKGLTFNKEDFDTEVLEAINEGIAMAKADLEAFVGKYASDPLTSNYIFGTKKFLQETAKEVYDFDNQYLTRMVAAQTGLYGNSGVEAIYPTFFKDSNENDLDTSENKYTLHFSKEQLPQVKAFWSLTMYDGKTQLFIHNELDRYLLNSSMMDQFVTGDDGSLTIYIQKDCPSKELETNWLPAPDGPFYATLRLYGPSEDTLAGKWEKPKMEKVN